MAEKTETIMQHLQEALQKNGETVEDVVAVLIGKVGGDNQSEGGVLHVNDEAILGELTRPYNRLPYETSIPDFYVWTANYVYALHRVIHYDAHTHDHEDTEIIALPRNPLQVYPECILP